MSTACGSESPAESPPASRSRVAGSCPLNAASRRAWRHRSHRPRGDRADHQQQRGECGAREQEPDEPREHGDAGVGQDPLRGGHRGPGAREPQGDPLVDVAGHGPPGEPGRPLPQARGPVRGGARGVPGEPGDLPLREALTPRTADAADDEQAERQREAAGDRRGAEIERPRADAAAGGVDRDRPAAGGTAHRDEGAIDPGVLAGADPDLEHRLGAGALRLVEGDHQRAAEGVGPAAEDRREVVDTRLDHDAAARGGDPGERLQPARVAVERHHVDDDLVGRRGVDRVRERHLAADVAAVGEHQDRAGAGGPGEADRLRDPLVEPGAPGEREPLDRHPQGVAVAGRAGDHPGRAVVGQQADPDVVGSVVQVGQGGVAGGLEPGAPGHAEAGVEGEDRRAIHVPVLVERRGRLHRGAVDRDGHAVEVELGGVVDPVDGEQHLDRAVLGDLDVVDVGLARGVRRAAGADGEQQRGQQYGEQCGRRSGRRPGGRRGGSRGRRGESSRGAWGARMGQGGHRLCVPPVLWKTLGSTFTPWSESLSTNSGRWPVGLR